LTVFDLRSEAAVRLAEIERKVPKVRSNYD
jgi:hypothetical protein